MEFVEAALYAAGMISALTWLFYREAIKEAIQNHRKEKEENASTKNSI